MIASQECIHPADSYSVEPEWIWRPLKKPISCSHLNAILEAEAEAYVRRRNARVSHLPALKDLRPFSLPAHAAFRAPSTPDLDLDELISHDQSQSHPDSDTLPEPDLDYRLSSRSSARPDSYYFDGDLELIGTGTSSDACDSESGWSADDEEASVDSMFEFAQFRAHPHDPRALPCKRAIAFPGGWEHSPVDIDFDFRDAEVDHVQRGLDNPNDETPELSPTSTISSSSCTWEIATPASVVQMPIPTRATVSGDISKMIATAATWDTFPSSLDPLRDLPEIDDIGHDESDDEEESYQRALLVSELSTQLHTLGVGREAFHGLTSMEYTSQLACIVELDDPLVRDAPMDAFELFCWADLVEDDKAASRRVSRVLSGLTMVAGGKHASKRISVAPAPSPVLEEDDNGTEASATLRGSLSSGANTFTATMGGKSRQSEVTVSSTAATAGSTRSSAIGWGNRRAPPPPPLHLKPLPALPELDFLDDEPPRISQRRDILGSSVNLDASMFKVISSEHSISAFPRPQVSPKTPRSKTFRPIQHIFSSMRV